MPRTLGEALENLAADPGAWKPFAGGTDLMVLLEAGKLPHQKFVNLWRLPELRGIEENASHVILGGLTTFTEIQRSAMLQRNFPLLCRAAAEIGGPATQNRATLAGNIANASPAADSPPALLVYDAEIELASHSGSRWVAYSRFHTDYKKMNLRPGEIIRRIRLPRHQEFGAQYFRKVGTRRAQAISKVCFAGAVELENGRIREIRIALGSVAPTAIRAIQTENALRGGRLGADLIRAARETLAQEIAPIDDFRSTARYRSRVAQNLLEEFLSRLSQAS
ncbi:MAG: FAD binding domain-containing protein [Candidatus Acidiferrales bacterium]